MARPANQPRKTPKVAPLFPEGMIAKEIKLEPRENSQERKQRLKKEMISLYLNDVLATLLAFLLVLALIGYSFWTLFRGDPDKDERQLAITILSCSGTAVVGFAFGKSKR